MRSSLVAMALGAVFVLGCPATEIKPVEIVLDEDGCSVCFMAVSQRKFAAETVTPDGQVDYYDDIGCLITLAKENKLPGESKSFVIDYDTAEWLEAGSAHYLVSAELPTPMSYGIAAFAAEEGANQLLAQYAGEVMDWKQLVRDFKP